MEVEPWEALDLDDSDLPSLLRPCKRRRSTSPTTTAAAAANPLSQPASPQPPIENHPEQLQQQPPASTSCRRTIPGPAGAVQAAMLRKNLDRENQNFSNHQEDNGEGFNGNHHNDGVLSTQDYIRRAMEGTAEFDDVFTRHPWLSALQFLVGDADADGLVPNTPISSIKKCLNGDKVVQVVAVIKSCTPNGLGGLIVLLKDPTGTVGATIHHKVLSQSKFGKNLTIGAVLILQEVAVFAPVRSAHYLNITLRNLVKVFCLNGGFTSKLYNSAYLIQYADPGTEYYGKAKTVEKLSTMQNVTQEDTEKRQCTRKTENSQNHSVIHRQNLFTGSIQSNNRATTNVSAAQRGHITLSQHACSELPEDEIRTRITGDLEEFVNGSDKGAKGDNLEGSLLNDTDNITNSLTKSTSEEIQGTYEVQKQKQPLILKASMPQWTDEQLDELFAGDEDDGSLF